MLLITNVLIYLGNVINSLFVRTRFETNTWVDKNIYNISIILEHILYITYPFKFMSYRSIWKINLYFVVNVWFLAKFFLLLNKVDKVLEKI